MPRLILTVTILLFSVTAEAYFAQQYTLTDLGSYEQGLMDKASNEIVAVQRASNGQFQSFTLYPTFQNLGWIGTGTFTQAKNIVHSLIVGDAETAAGNRLKHGFLYEAGTLRALPDMGTSNARCVNADQDVFGSADGLPGIWLNAETFVEFGTLDGTIPGSGFPVTCNDKGDSAGSSSTPEGSSVCTFWSVDGSTISCHPQNGTVWSQAIDMTSGSFLIGNAIQNHRRFGFLWLWSTISWLMPLSGDQHTRAASINESGDIVGQSCKLTTGGDATCTPIGWENGRAFRFLDRLTEPLPDGWLLNDAIGISNDGWILVVAYKNFQPSMEVNGQQRLVLLRPVETAVTSYYKWRFKIWQYYVNQYWRTIRAWYVAHK